MKMIIFTLLVTFSAVYANQLPCNCRLGNLNRIVNGQIAATHSIPWMVSLADFEGNHFCEGTIINEEYVLTTTQCIKEKGVENIIIRVGVTKSNEMNPNKIHYPGGLLSTKFEKPGDIGDFALIQLQNPIQFVSGEVEPACFNLEDKDFEGDLLSAGWGSTERMWKDANDENSEMNYPKKNSELLKFYFSTQFDYKCEDHEICVLSKNEEDSICNGDLGGPLMHTKNGKTSVIGMASYDSSTKEGNRLYFCNGHATYARASAYKDEFDQNVQNYCKA